MLNSLSIISHSILNFQVNWFGSFHTNLTYAVRDWRQTDRHIQVDVVIT